MTATMWTFAPAGVLGAGSADARPYPGVAVRLPALPPVGIAAQGTGVPTARLRGMTGIPCAPRGEFIAQRFVAKHTQNDGTTLGFHPSGRPLS